MKNEYEFLEEFILMSASGFRFNWSNDSEGRPYELEFTNEDSRNKSLSPIHIRFSHPRVDELEIKIMEPNKGSKTISVNVSKVNKLMSYLTVAEYSFQISAHLEMHENEFNKINHDVDEILQTGKLRKQLFTDDERNPHMFHIDLNKKQKMQLFFPPINNNYLGFQTITIHINNSEKSDIKTTFRRFISIHKIKDFPFLNSIAQIPQSTNPDLNPDIEEFINYFSNLDSTYLSPIAQTVQLNMQLNRELDSRLNKKNKRLKI